MKSAIKITILLSLILVLTACTSTPEKTLQYNFKQGYGNLVISVSKDTPPDIVYPYTSYGIIVDLKNEGAYDLTNGKIKILGFNDKYFVLEESEKEIISRDTEDNILRGRSPSFPGGEDTFIIFPFKTNDLFPGAESYPTHYFIKADYDYKTELTQTVCISTKSYETYDGGCKAEPKISLSGQGSPLAITTLEWIGFSGFIPQIEFRFTLKNKGRGDIKQVRLGRARLGKQPLDCEFRRSTNPDKRIFDFIEDTKEIILICKGPPEVESKQNSYSTTIYLELPFTYSLREKKPITLEE